MSGSLGDLIFNLFDCSRLVQAGEDPEIVTENGPADHHFTVLKSFRSRGLAHEVADDNADSSFGPGAAFEAFTHAGFVFQTVTQFGDVAGAESAPNSVTFQEFFVGFAVDAAVAPGVFEGEVLFFNESLKGGFDLFWVAGFFFFEEVVDNESFTGFAEPEVVPEFNFSTAFSSFDDLDITVVEAEDLFLIGKFAPADHPFVGLFDGGGELIEDTLDPVRYLSYLSFF